MHCNGVESVPFKSNGHFRLRQQRTVLHLHTCVACTATCGTLLSQLRIHSTSVNVLRRKILVIVCAIEIRIFFLIYGISLKFEHLSLKEITVSHSFIQVSKFNMVVYDAAVRKFVSKLNKDSPV